LITDSCARVTTPDVPLVTDGFVVVDPGPIGSGVLLARAWWPGSMTTTNPVALTDCVETAPGAGATGDVAGVDEADAA
jgi:hypothetical protein